MKISEFVINRSNVTVVLTRIRETREIIRKRVRDQENSKREGEREIDIESSFYLSETERDRIMKNKRK